MPRYWPPTGSPIPISAKTRRSSIGSTAPPWHVERSFTATEADVDGYLTLTLAEVDCIATILLNGEVIAKTQNSFIRYDIDVTGKVHAGDNTLRLEFDVTRDVAKARSDAHPFPIPFTYNYLTNGLEGVHMNFVRKAACHAGWDWGICLMPIGVYGTMSLRKTRLARQDSVQVDQAHGKTSVELSIKTRIFAFAHGEVELEHAIDGQTITDKVAVRQGENVFTHNITIHNPKLWWPAGQGEQPLYELTTNLEGEKTTRKIGLRKLEWIIEKDEIDHTLQVPHQRPRHHHDGRQLDSRRRHPLAHHSGGHPRPAGKRQGRQHEHAAHLGRRPVRARLFLRTLRRARPPDLARFHVRLHELPVQPRIPRRRAHRDHPAGPPPQPPRLHRAVVRR